MISQVQDCWQKREDARSFCPELANVKQWERWGGTDKDSEKKVPGRWEENQEGEFAGS